MSSSGWNRTLVDLKKELSWIKDRAEDASTRLDTLGREAESLKIEILLHSLEKQRKALARQRGLASVGRDTKKIGASLAVAASGLVLGGLIGRDKYTALNAGLSGLDAVLRLYGETRWAVYLGKEIAVMPVDEIPPRGIWVTLDSLEGATQDLRAEASQGAQVGNLGNVISRLGQSKKLVYLRRLNSG